MKVITNWIGGLVSLCLAFILAPFRPVPGALGLFQRDAAADDGKNEIRREIEFVRESVNKDDRTVKAILSTENPVRAYYRGDVVNEILAHNDDAIDLSRAAGGLPLLFNHDRDRQIGVIRDLKVEGGQLVGTLKFSRGQFAEDIYQDIQDDIRRHVSIMGERLAVEELPDNVIRTAKWKPYEASVVTVPGDVAAQIRRDDNAGDDGNVVDFKANREKIRRQAEEEGRKIERKRIGAIRDMFERHAERTNSDLVRDLMDDCITRGDSAARASERLLELLGGELEPVARDYTQANNGGNLDRNGQRQERATAGNDAIDNFVTGATNGILARAGMLTTDEEKKLAINNEFRSYHLADIARQYLTLTGAKIPAERLRMVGSAFTRAGTITHGTSDFSNILENVANKAMMKGWDEAVETWSMWVRIGNLTDFRQASRVNISEFPDLDLVPAGAEYKYASMLDLKETIQLLTYGKLFSISRQAIINDDVQAFTRIPQAGARAANRKVGDLVYNGILLSNSGLGPVLNQDSTALFDASGHGNYKASGSTAPTVARVNAIRTAMGTQKGLQDAATLGIRPRYMITPLALEGTARALAAAEYDPAGTAGTLTPNTVRGTFEVIAEHRLDVVPKAYYMAADPNMHDTIEVAFLDGNPNPFLDEQDGWTVDGRSFKVRIDVAAAALDYRGLYKDLGDA